MGEGSSDEPRIARYKPFYAELVKGKTYLWCSCGRSKDQPFCDGSHRDTNMRPVRYVACEEGEEVLFCGCKRTADKPFCDGAHNNLLDTYAEDDPDSDENKQIPTVEADGGGKALLDGGCYVRSLSSGQLMEHEALKYCAVITRGDGAQHQAQFFFELESGESPVVGFGNRHVILFVAEGSGTVFIAGRRFDAGPDTGLHVRPGEAFQLFNRADTALTVFVAVCPQTTEPEWLGAMPENFDKTFERRTVRMDPAARRTMAVRFFQVLVDRRIGSDVATQFIGEIPISKATPHRHLYEESLVVMTGEGFMWTESRKAPVKVGDVIFLPRKQVHSLQCTDPSGMKVMGVIYPGDNPSINY